MNPFNTTKDQTKSPPLDQREAHDWRTEPWVKEDYPDEIDMLLSYTILLALACDADDPRDPMSEEDGQVFLLMRPDICERVSKTDAVDDVVRHRLAQALAQSMKMVREAWYKKPKTPETLGVQR